MNGIRLLSAAVVAAALPLLAQATGCIVPAGLDDCDVYPHAGCGTTTTTSSSSSSSGTGGDGGSIPAGCDPSKSNEPVADTCGVFVSPTGDDGNPGTKEKPLKTLTTAVAKGTTIYACAGAMPFKEALVIDKAVALFGAVNCAKGWVYDKGNKTQLTAGADEIPLKLTSEASGSDVYDFAITSAEAMTPGGSSIAVIADGVTAGFTRTDITAGNGKDGFPGTTPTDPVGPTDATDTKIAGNKGLDACMDSTKNDGGSFKENELCPAASGGPIGGKGGDGTAVNGSNGDLQPTASTQTALGGLGQPNQDPTNSWDCVPGSGLGAPGTKGGFGDAGVGAAITDLGAIDKNGFTGAAGGSGGIGKPGQGGGGGGGAKGKSMCAGASGGGGGAGGCGGKGGTGGQAGGASIGIIGLGATLSFDSVTIKVASGGNGGDGGDGQIGGTGGKGGTGGNGSGSNLSNACDGGNGGQGGQGGKGGGGRGGHAIGIAYTGTTAPATKGVTFATKGTPGGGGSGDTANGNMGNGAPGVAEDVQAFP